MTALFWRAYIVLLALRWVPRINIGNRVRYRGKVWTVYNSNGELSLYRDGVKNWKGSWPGRECLQYVPFEEVRKVQTPREWWVAFRNGRRFYMQNWFDIWRREGIHPWMMGCQIWGGERKLPIWWRWLCIKTREIPEPGG